MTAATLQSLGLAQPLPNAKGGVSATGVQDPAPGGRIRPATVVPCQRWRGWRGEGKGSKVREREVRMEHLCSGLPLATATAH